MQKHLAKFRQAQTAANALSPEVQAQLIRALQDCLIVMAVSDAGDTNAARFAREALAAAGAREEKAVKNYLFQGAAQPLHQHR